MICRVRLRVLFISCVTTFNQSVYTDYDSAQLLLIYKSWMVCCMCRYCAGRRRCLRSCVSCWALGMCCSFHAAFTLSPPSRLSTSTTIPRYVGLSTVVTCTCDRMYESLRIIWCNTDTLLAADVCCSCVGVCSLLLMYMVVPPVCSHLTTLFLLLSSLTFTRSSRTAGPYTMLNMKCVLANAWTVLICECVL